MSETPFSPLEWGEPNERHVIRGWLRGHPEITLFLIRLNKDRRRGTMTGAFVPDSEDGKGQLESGLITWLKVRAIIYLEDFHERLSAVECGERGQVSAIDAAGSEAEEYQKFAAELAHRDREIDRLRAALSASTGNLILWEKSDPVGTAHFLPERIASNESLLS